ncbi:MAG: molybdopterin oxidoreductase, partial [Gammaproteobacteria bacterium]|nr:molybdopterin oxidoreductase [Gammaproteobacteria bacterium]
LYSNLGKSRTWIAISSLLVIIGGMAQMYVIIIGGQAYPLQMFPGMEVVSSTFSDAAAYHAYTPSLPEILLGLGGVAITIFMIVFGCKVLNFLPASLADEAVDPHSAATDK